MLPIPIEPTSIAHLTPPEASLLRRFEIPGPRYTSYPTADRFIEAFGPEDYKHWLAARDGSSAAMNSPLSVYVHLPFCESVCYYCACNKVITRHHERVPEYLYFLEREMHLVSQHLTGSRQLEQLHFGGGTPTFCSMAELEHLIHLIRNYFEWTDSGEYSIEVDPRTVSQVSMKDLAKLGFNRISLGVQDFDREVQLAVNRVQSFESTQAIIGAARSAQIKSINLDLIYGLPHQTRASFARTLQQVLQLAPERIALYHYAHLPERFKPQRRIHERDLPSSAEKTSILLDAIETLGEAGYDYIGMDHFARPDDELARAARDGRLHRNFQGYSTRSDCDLIGLGVSSIGKIGPTYVQNERTLDAYYDALRQDRLPVARGILLNEDDLLRRSVIMSLMCQFTISKEVIESTWFIDFDHYFQKELTELASFVDSGLVELDKEWVSVTPTGRFLIRAVAMVFDRHLRIDQRAKNFSRIV